VTLLAYRVHQEENAKSRKIRPARKKREMLHYRWLVDFYIPQSGAKLFPTLFPTLKSLPCMVADQIMTVPPFTKPSVSQHL
jgi:hypothetical protein